MFKLPGRVCHFSEGVSVRWGLYQIPPNFFRSQPLVSCSRRPEGVTFSESPFTPIPVIQSEPHPSPDHCWLCYRKKPLCCLTHFKGNVGLRCVCMLCKLSASHAHNFVAAEMNCDTPYIHCIFPFTLPFVSPSPEWPVLLRSFSWLPCWSCLLLSELHGCPGPPRSCSPLMTHPSWAKMFF